MLSVDEARAQILSGFSPTPVIEVVVRDALRCASARDLHAPHALPRFDNSAMDGFAVRREDVTGVPVTLTVVGEVKAGDDAAGVDIERGTAVRIMTGAPVPAGADAVVPVEDTTSEEDQVTISELPPPHGHIRPAGDDVAAGDLLVRAGTELDAGALAMLASLGLSPVAVHDRPRVAILSTGDELVSPEVEPGPGQIRDSNSVALKALVEEAGGVPHLVGPIRDDERSVRDALTSAATGSDLVLSSGGVSVGRYDFVKSVLEEIGTVDLWRVKMQPGKPVVSGRIGEVPFLGLPGNPVSIHIGFEQFARPAIRKMRGCRELLRPTITARLAARLEKSPGRLHFVRVRLHIEGDAFVATPTGAQGSHIQSSLVGCHGVARFDVDESLLEEGAAVTVEVWDLP
jgi:molybdopterin molybdotransferase